MRIAILLIAAGCARAEAPSFDEPWLAPHATPTVEPLAVRAVPRLRAHMRQELDDLRALDRALVTGRLDEAHALAHLVTVGAAGDGEGITAWHDDAAGELAAASAVEHAPDAGESYRRLAWLGASCARCHEHARVVVFDAHAEPAPPPDAPTEAARIARHAWAAARIAEGLVGPDRTRWRTGLEVLAATQLAGGDTQMGAHMQDIALRALVADEDRATTYGLLLATCAGCHAVGAVAQREAKREASGLRPQRL